eukprot:TRINITY_DN26557_c0_g1_i1.p1 TRINITY_DN26557_c0_g1~~TRINITY_DN26557_c0_g1_i1.p1  ORF type:complete len:526 (+),score=69.54 TRINITY_DN26557_c0_g1_i1:109-1686(+)
MQTLGSGGLGKPPVAPSPAAPPPAEGAQWVSTPLDEPAPRPGSTAGSSAQSEHSAVPVYSRQGIASAGSDGSGRGKGLWDRAAALHSPQPLRRRPLDLLLGPRAATPPADLQPGTPPAWRKVRQLQRRLEEAERALMRNPQYGKAPPQLPPMPDVPLDLLCKRFCGEYLFHRGFVRPRPGWFRNYGYFSDMGKSPDGFNACGACRGTRRLGGPDLRCPLCVMRHVETDVRQPVLHDEAGQSIKNPELELNGCSPRSRVRRHVMSSEEPPPDGGLGAVAQALVQEGKSSAAAGHEAPVEDLKFPASTKSPAATNMLDLVNFMRKGPGESGDGRGRPTLQGDRADDSREAREREDGAVSPGVLDAVRRASHRLSQSRGRRRSSRKHGGLQNVAKKLVVARRMGGGERKDSASPRQSSPGSRRGSTMNSARGQQDAPSPSSGPAPPSPTGSAASPASPGAPRRTSAKTKPAPKAGGGAGSKPSTPAPGGDAKAKPAPKAAGGGGIKPAAKAAAKAAMLNLGPKKKQGR